MAISPIQNSTAVQQSQTVTNATPADNKPATKASAVPQDKVTISAPAKQAVAANPPGPSSTAETQQSGGQ